MTMLFWVVTPCRLVGRHERFGETYCLHLQDVTTQKNIIIILTAERTSDLTTTYKSTRRDVTTQKITIDIFTAVRT
jgi:hypothetical protein